ncbi:MAG TPA: SDR family oxidoreductase [Polyangiaceae bacterium]|nr:SDR family oxidoreductase [Polyangiaceae bacterium]
MKELAIVTGGTGALGVAVARRFADAGYEVHVTASHEPEPNHSGPGVVHVVDLTNFDAVRAFAAKFARVHAIALAAGGYAGAKLDALTASGLEQMLDVNFKTATYALAAFATKLGTGSAAVVVGSQSFEGAANMAAYAASKAAVVSLARSAALEWKPRGVRVNAVLPDVIDTPANRRAMPDADVSRWAKPEQVAEVIVWLCSRAASAVSGNAILVGV